MNAGLRTLIATTTFALIPGCAQPPKPLYMWERLPGQQYETLVRTGAGIEDQIRELQAHAEKARAAAAALPPGFRAHLGMLHLTNGNAEEARSLWNAEKTAFPEASPYMDQLLRRLEGNNGTKPAK